MEQEVDPLNVDHFSCTPLVRMGLLGAWVGQGVCVCGGEQNSVYQAGQGLKTCQPQHPPSRSSSPQMWACALGHLEAAVLLFRWNRQALSIPDSLGRLPLAVAHSRGHVRLARCLEELQRQEVSVEPPLSLSPPSSSPDTGEGCL